MPSPSSQIKKRSITIAGHRTSITLEDIFWKTLKDIAEAQGVSLATLIEDIDKRRDSNLSSALRTFAMIETLRMGMK
ncbi:MAG: ribbon-helix-helix domain-containing protein [Sphingomonadales bacterium]